MTHVKLLTILIFALLLTGCGGDNNPAGNNNNNSPLPPGTIMPLKVGNVWSGNVIETDGSDSATATLVYYVESDSIVDTETWYRVKEKTPSANSFFAWMINRSDGIQAVLNDTTLGVDQPALFFKYPVTKGENYSLDFGNEHLDIFVESIDSKVTVPQGSYTCCVYSIDAGGVETDVYLAPNVGFVKIESSYMNYVSTWALDSLILQ